jgi:hypothetical protein
LEKQTLAADATVEFEGHPHWQLVQRILGSPQFTRSARLKTFLQYVTRCALLEHADQVTEQQIGVHVFGRPADYNAGDDNIVRSQARFLRAKLAEYFDSPAGRDEPIVLIIPKGAYLPHFAAREEHAPAVELAGSGPERHTPPVDGAAPRGNPRWIWAPALAVLVCLAAALMLVRQRFPAAPTRPPDSPLWSRLFDARQPTTIVASDYIFSMVQEAAGRTLTLDEYLGADYFSRVSKLNAGSGLEHLFPNIAQRHYTGFENVTSVARLMGVKQAQSTRTIVRFARDMTMRDIGAGNLILLGSKQSNPWVLLYESKLNFQFEYQSATHNIFIANRGPRAGEESEYRPSALDELSRVIYGGIAFLPNLNHGGNVLILQGTSMGGTEGALEILDNPALFQGLARRIDAERKRGGGLPYFEALIRTRTVNGVAGESSIAALRILPD